MDDKAHFFCRIWRATQLLLQATETSEKGTISDLNALQIQLHYDPILQQNYSIKTTHFSIQLHIQSQSLWKPALIALNNGVIYTQL